MSEFGEMLEKSLTTVQLDVEYAVVVVVGLSKLNSKHQHLPAKPSTSSLVEQIKDARSHKLLSPHKSTCVALLKSVAVKGIAAFQKQVFWERAGGGINNFQYKHVAAGDMHYDCLPQKSTRVKGYQTPSTELLKAWSE